MSAYRTPRRNNSRTRPTVLLNSSSAEREQMNGLNVGLGFSQTQHAVALLPLAALLEEFNPLETFQDVAFGAQGADRSETSVLRHKLIWWLGRLGPAAKRRDSGHTARLNTTESGHVPTAN